MLYRGDWLEYLGPEHLRADASYALRGRHPYIHEAAAPKDRAHGLTVWGAVYVAPREAINQQMVQAAGGLLYHGMFPGRDHDVTAVGVISGIFSDRLPRQGAETVIEAEPPLPAHALVLRHAGLPVRHPPQRVRQRRQCGSVRRRDRDRVLSRALRTRNEGTGRARQARPMTACCGDGGSARSSTVVKPARWYIASSSPNV